MGNFSGETVVGRTGSFVPAAVAADILAYLDPRPEPFPPPPNSKRARVCSLSGMAATAICPSTRTEYLRTGVEIAPCSFHRRTAAGISLTYPAKYGAWVHAFGLGGNVEAGTDDAASVRIAAPLDGSVYYLDPSAATDAQAVRVEVVASGAEPIEIRSYEASAPEEESSADTDRDRPSVVIHRGRSGDPVIWHFPLAVGRWRIEARSAWSTDSVVIDVR